MCVGDFHKITFSTNMFNVNIYVAFMLLQSTHHYSNFENNDLSTHSVYVRLFIISLNKHLRVGYNTTLRKGLPFLDEHKISQKVLLR